MTEQLVIDITRNAFITALEIGGQLPPVRQLQCSKKHQSVERVKLRVVVDVAHGGAGQLRLGIDRRILGGMPGR